MANDDLIKKIQKVVKDEVMPVKELTEILKSKIDQIELFQNVTVQQVRTIKDQQSVMNEKLDNITGQLDDPDTGLKRLNNRMDSNTAAVIKLEETVNGYGDMYKINDSNIRKMEKRLEPLEERATVSVPPEFLLEPLPEAA